MSEKTISVLVVDDELQIRAALKEILEDAGYHVILAVDGNEAIELYESEGPIDLVITDLGMPLANGWDLIANLNERAPDLPIIIVTAWGGSIDHQKARALGINLIINKPFTVSEVKNALRTELNL